MKKAFLTIVVSSVLLLSFTEIVKTKFKADTKNSKINWKGFKPTGSHFGTINISAGDFILDDKNMIVAGEFTIDMSSIVDLDMEADNKYNAKLVGHLKSPDFFDAEKYPNGVFKINKSEKKEGKILISGDLTLKDKTNPVSFIADVNINGDKLTLKSESFMVDRSKFDVRYKSKSFYNDLKDAFVNDDMEISIEVIANK